MLILPKLLLCIKGNANCWFRRILVVQMSTYTSLFLSIWGVWTNYETEFAGQKKYFCMIQPSNFMYFQIEHVCITYFKSYPRRKCDLKPFWRNFLFRRGSLFMYFYPKLFYCNCNKDILSVMEPMTKILLWIVFTCSVTHNE